jgi:hypothetical protein
MRRAAALSPSQRATSEPCVKSSNQDTSLTNEIVAAVRWTADQSKDVQLSGRGFEKSGAALRPCAIVRTYGGQGSRILTLLSSLLLGGHPGLHIILMDTGHVPFVGLQHAVTLANALAGRHAVTLTSHNRTESHARFGVGDDVEDYGYIATDLAINDLVLAWKAAVGGKSSFPGSKGAILDAALEDVMCDSIFVTNGDNVYGLEFLLATTNAIANGAGAVATGWVSHYNHDVLGPNAARKASYVVGHVDLGAVLISTAELAKTGLRFTLVWEDKAWAVLQKGRMALRDGQFFSRLKEELGDRAVTLRQTLFIHQ